MKAPRWYRLSASSHAEIRKGKLKHERPATARLLHRRISPGYSVGSSDAAQLFYRVAHKSRRLSRGIYRRPPWGVLTRTGQNPSRPVGSTNTDLIVESNNLLIALSGDPTLINPVRKPHIDARPERQSFCRNEPNPPASHGTREASSSGNGSLATTSFG